MRNVQNQHAKKFTQLLLAGLGYMLMGNLLATVMTISLAAFGGSAVIMGLATLFAMAIYLMLAGVPAYKDGLYKSTKQSQDNHDRGKYRWLAVGVIGWGIMLVPSVVFLLGGLGEGMYRLICGAVYPLSLFLVEDVDGVRSMLPWVPYVFIGFYALTVPACYVGYALGNRQK